MEIQAPNGLIVSVETGKAVLFGKSEDAQALIDAGLLSVIETGDGWIMFEVTQSGFDAVDSSFGEGE